jgi:hypothetical protein
MYTNQRLSEKASTESGIDIDWYFLDPTGKIAIVASARGLIPDPIASDMDRLRKMISYFRSLPILSNNIIIENHVLDKIKHYTQQQKDRYLEDLYFMSSRGFYYFDKVEIIKYFDFSYHLKAKPTIPLIIDKSDNRIQEFLPPITLHQSLDDIKLLSVNELA